MLSVRDYVERLSMHFDLKIQSDHFGNEMSLSIEGCNIELVYSYQKLQSEFYSHLSDDSRQHTFTTHAHMTSM